MLLLDLRYWRGVVRCIRRAVRSARLDADDCRLSTHNGLCRKRRHNGVVPVDGGGNTAACKTRRNARASIAAASISQSRVCRVAKLAGKEEMLIFHRVGAA